MGWHMRFTSMYVRVIRKNAHLLEDHTNNIAPSMTEAFENNQSVMRNHKNMQVCGRASKLAKQLDISTQAKKMQ